jgi:hypothetical protein
MNARVCLPGIIRRTCRPIVLAEVSEKNGGQATLRRRKACFDCHSIQDFSINVLNLTRTRTKSLRAPGLSFEIKSDLVEYPGPRPLSTPGFTSPAPRYRSVRRAAFVSNGLGPGKRGGGETFDRLRSLLQFVTARSVSSMWERKRPKHKTPPPGGRDPNTTCPPSELVKGPDKHE